MSDTLNLALKISAIDVAGGVLRRFQGRIAGMGKDAQRLQRDYDDAISHIQRGLKGLAVADYGYHKLKPLVGDAADLQDSMLAIKGILQGSHPQAKLLADQMERVKNNSIEVAKHMQYGATQVNQVTEQLIQGGQPLSAVLGKRGSAYSVEALAELKNADPAGVAEQISNIGHAFQLSPKQYGVATNTIAKGLVTASGSLQDLFRDMQQVGSLAHMYGGTSLKDTVLAIKAAAPLGREAGSDLAQFLQQMAAPQSLTAYKEQRALGLNFYDKKGNFIGLHAGIEELKQHIYELPTQKARIAAMQAMFGTQGGKAAAQLIMPSKPGAKSYDEVVSSYKNQASLAQMIKVREEGLHMQMQELSSTTTTSLALAFTPALKPLTKIVHLTNELVGNLGTIADHHQDIAKGITYTAGAAVAGAGLYGISQLALGAGPGGRVIKSILKGTGKTATGIAEGKAVQAATGVAPVFVTNWPAGLGSNGVINSAKRDEKSAASIAERVAKDVSVGAIVGRTGTIGAGIWGLYEKLKGEIHEYHMSRAQLQQQVLNAPFGLGHGAHRIGRSPSEALSGTLKIELTNDGRIKLKSLQKDGLPDFDVDTGPSMVMP